MSCVLQEFEIAGSAGEQQHQRHHHHHQQGQRPGSRAAGSGSHGGHSLGGDVGGSNTNLTLLPHNHHNNVDGAATVAESPMGTVHSWDSHSHYRRRSASPDLSLYSGVIVYCDHKHLRTPTGVVRLLLIVTTIATLTCLCTSGTVKVGLFMLPLVGRIRLMMFVTLITILVTTLLLFLDVTHMIYLFPFNWGRINAYLYLALSVAFLIASSLLLHMVLMADAFQWVPKWSHHQILLTGCLGYTCCVQALLIGIIQRCSVGPYEPVPHGDGTDETDALHLHPTVSSPNTTSPPHHLNYKPIINYQLQPSAAAAVGSRPPVHNYLDGPPPILIENNSSYQQQIREQQPSTSKSVVLS